MAARRRIALVVIGVVVLAIAVITVVASATSADRSSGENVAVPPTGIVAEEPQRGGGAATDGGTTSDAAREAAPAVPGTDEAKQQPLSVVPVDRSIVRRAQLGVEVSDVGRAAADVRLAATGAGGFVSDERSRSEDATLTVKVPAERLDQAVERIAVVGKVTTRSQQAEDVTEKVVDLEGRLATQRASVARVRALLERAASVGEIVEIESELTRREADLESLQRRLNAVTAQVALSTVTVELRGIGSAPPAAPDEGFLAGLTNGWEALLTFGRWVGTVFGAVLPFAPLLLAIGWAAWLLRRFRRRRQALAG
ncbi:MAG: DUF4349 domain-containing protein [Pseudonocardiales bacterium]|nr:DUF4349 domain-containing protein [Pseudonocardiales bacterium]